MKKLMPVLMLGLFVSCETNSTNQSTSAVTGDDYETLNNIVTVLSPKAYNEQDTALLNQLLHEKFQLIDDEGSKFSKNDELEYVSKYGPSYDSFDYEVERLEIFENGTAVIGGKGIIRGISVQGQAYVSSYHATDVFIKENGKWKAITSHVSGVKEEVYENAPSE